METATAAAKTPAPKADAATGQKALATRLIALKASWDTIQDEIAKLPASRKQELVTEFESMARSCKAVVLFPSTVVGLSEGFDALDAVNGKTGEWAKANSAMLQSVPEEAKKALESNVALLRQSRNILRRAAESIKASEACSKESNPAARHSKETVLKN